MSKFLTQVIIIVLIQFYHTIRVVTRKGENPARMLQARVIMDVTTPEEARIAEESGTRVFYPN